jgi:hypothetical protein
MNKLPCSVNGVKEEQISNWMPNRSQPNVVETRLVTNTKEQLEMTTMR